MGVEMTLKEKREKWEKGGEEVLAVTLMNGAYATLFVVLDFGGEFSLHRYVPSYSQPETKWDISVDISNSTLEKCLGRVSYEFIDVYPIN